LPIHLVLSRETRENVTLCFGKPGFFRPECASFPSSIGITSPGDPTVVNGTVAAVYQLTVFKGALTKNQINLLFDHLLFVSKYINLQFVENEYSISRWSNQSILEYI
jgi:hypothetical protein